MNIRKVSTVKRKLKNFEFLKKRPEFTVSKSFFKLLSDRYFIKNC